MAINSGEGGPTVEFAAYWLQQRPDLDPKVLTLELTLARLNLLTKKSVTRVAESHGITATDYSLMAVIKRGGKEGPIRPSDLGRLFDLQPSVVTYRVNQLVERGFVDRGAKSDDRRVILLTLTPSGVATVDAIMTTLVNRLRERLQALDDIPGGGEQLQKLLAAVARRWEQLDAAEANG